ncbi:MAG: MAPEG family protein [Gammaproteobacteria bacterium]|nr:MAPEG family protein [Gammaproteobacteria bacterium]MCP5201499.1 MAPEG family protein [Gammaproteobacteria bacterium]
MTATATAMLGLIAWTMVLTLTLLSARTAAMLKGHPVNTFTQDGNELAAISQRITRAHGNSLEWLVIPVGLLGYAIATGQTGVTDGLAMLFLGARVLQSVCHIISTATPLVLARATFFTVHNVIAIIWLVKLMGA